MADIMMMASPAPPANWMTLRQSSTMGPARVTSTTESPVVVHPLTDSNSARENGISSTDMNGHAEKRMTVAQPTRTMTPPSWTVRVMSEGGRNRVRRPAPRRARRAAGRPKAQAWGPSPGKAAITSSGDAITGAVSIRMTPTAEAMAA